MDGVVCSLSSRTKKIQAACVCTHYFFECQHCIHAPKLVMLVAFLSIHFSDTVSGEQYL